LQNADEIVKFLTTKKNKYHVAHPTTHKNTNKLFWDVKVGEVDKSKPFNYETILGNYNMFRYNLYPTMTPHHFNVATFHFFVMLALIGFQMGDVIMSFMSLLGH
jgi:hypothetical protein